MKKRLFGIFLSLALVLSMMPVGMMVAQAESGTATTGEGTADNPYIVHNWIALKDKMAEGGYIQLGEDVTDQTKNSSSYLSVPSGATVTLDLNGHKIDRGLASARAIEYGYAILVQGSLTVTDSSTDKTGMITGGFNSDNGGGVYVNGTFNMTGGTIANNRASGVGGGVITVGKFNMSGGSITGNTASKGGGVWMNYGSMSLTGGSITGNTADAECGGVVITTQTTFNLSGNPIVTGNTIGSGTTCNLWLGGSNGSAIISDSMIKVTAPLTQGASIGVTLGEGRSTRWFTDGFEENNPDTKPAAFFTSDDSNYYVGDAEEGVLSRVTSYDLWVGGTQVTSANAGDLSGIDGVSVADGGEAKYNAETKTLALKDVTISNSNNSRNAKELAGIYSEDPLTISVTGTNTINGGTCTGSGEPCGIYSVKTLTFNGDGILTSTGGTGSDGVRSVGIHSSEAITFGGTGTINAMGAAAGYSSCGVRGAGAITVNSGTLNASGANSSDSKGINAYSNGEIVINGGIVTATGYTCALNKAPTLGTGITAGGSTNFDGSSAVIYNADDNENYKWFQAPFTPSVITYPLYIAGVQVTDANLTGSGWTYTPLTNTLALSDASITTGYEFNNGYSAAIYANQNLTITGTGTVGSEGIACGICVDGANTLTIDGADTNLTVFGTSNGMDAYAMNGNIVINNGIVNTTGGGNGIKTNKGTVTVNGGTVTATGTGNGTIASGNGITTDCFIIHDGKVTARGNETDNTSYGIFCNNTDPNKTCYSFYGGEVLATGVSEGVLTNRSMVSSGGVTKLISQDINGTEPIDFSDKPAGAGSSIFYKWFHSYPSTYVISFMPGDGTGTMAEVTVLYGDYVLPASTFTAPSGKVFDRWQTDRYGSDYIETFAAGAVVSISDNTTFTATWKDAPAPSGGGGGEPSYKVEVPTDVENGSVTVKPTSAKEGDTVTITPTPDEGFIVDDVKVTDKDGKEIEVTDNGDGTYSFKMPASKVTVTPVIIEDGDVPLVNRPFVDVPEDSWFYDAVYYCYDNGYIKGVDETHFAPNDTTTRAMIVTILWRMEGAPSQSASQTALPVGASQDKLRFEDVEKGSWYEAAVNWAAENGVVKGMSDTTFAPNAKITREQMATILARYAEFKGKKGDDYAVDLSGFADLDSVSDWALDAMNWSVATELMNGVTGTTLDPKGNATRAQVATLMQRLCENIL